MVRFSGAAPNGAGRATGGWLPKRAARVGLALVLSAALMGPRLWAGEVTLASGDRVVFVGDTLIERAAASDYWETWLTLRRPGVEIVFRNLGWSGDTVGGDARAGFDTPREGYQRLIDGVKLLQPTVVVLGYGGNQAFDGPGGIEPFQRGLNRLLDDLAPTGARFVLLGLVPHERLPAPLPNSKRSNLWRAEYNALLARTAEQRGLGFVDLFAALGGPAMLAEHDSAAPSRPLTDNGIHLSAYGYWRAAAAVDAGLGPPPEQPYEVALDLALGEYHARGTRLVSLVTRPHLKLELIDDRLPLPISPGEEGPSEPAESRVWRIQGLAEGVWQLNEDGQPAALGSASQWAQGLAVVGGPSAEQTERLRQVIRRKNELYFYRWRPQNETYLFGFRKHEQGQNAIEVPRFDPLVADQEQLILDLARPRQRTWELVRVEETTQ